MRAVECSSPWEVCSISSSSASSKPSGLAAAGLVDGAARLGAAEVKLACEHRSRPYLNPI